MSVLRVLAGLALLLAFWGLGELVSEGLGLPLPGSVVGMLGLWAALEAGVVRLSWVREAGEGLLGWLALLFVPVGVGWVEHSSDGAEWAAALVVVVVGTALGIGVVGAFLGRALRGA